MKKLMLWITNLIPQKIIKLIPWKAILLAVWKDQEPKILKRVESNDDSHVLWDNNAYALFKALVHKFLLGKQIKINVEYLD